MDDGQALKITTTSPNKFKRVVTWKRIDENTIHSLIEFDAEGPKPESVKINRYYVKKDDPAQ